MLNIVKIGFRSLPDSTQANLDYLFRKNRLVDSWGGPLNGQMQRQLIVNNILDKIEFKRIVETGTFRGVTTQYFAKQFDGEILSIETVRRFYLFASKVLRNYTNVSLFHGNSVHYLIDLSQLCHH